MCPEITDMAQVALEGGSVGYRLDYIGLSVVISGDTRPSYTLVDACVGADLLIRETFPSTPVFAQKAGLHTSPTVVGKVLDRAEPQMSVMRHLAVDHDTVGPAYGDMRTMNHGPVTIAQLATR